MRPRFVVPALLAGAAVAAAVLAQPSQPARAQADEATPALPNVSWSFEGPFGTFDRAALQRGFQIYSQVCSTCHSMNLLTYDDLAGPEGLGYTEAEVKAIAAQKQVDDIDKSGKPIKRPARPSDHFAAPFPNEAAAAASLGKAPPDLSDIIKARAGGPRYVYGILTGFREPPKGFQMPPTGGNYNLYFPGHVIAMPQPLQDNSVQYADGTKATLDQEAHDVVTFLSWAAEPELEARHRIGLEAILFLIVLTAMLYAAKRKIWADVH